MPVHIDKLKQKHSWPFLLNEKKIKHVQNLLRYIPSLHLEFYLELKSTDSGEEDGSDNGEDSK